MTPAALIPEWTDEHRAGFQTQPMVFKHGLLDTGLFTEEAVARLLETHPDDMTDVNINDIREDGTARVRTGTRGGLKGDQLLEAVKEGRLWINIRQAFLASGGTVVARFFDELRALNRGFNPFHIYANLLVSAPGARVPYHADTPGVTLLHLMGRKRVWIYPNHGKHLEDTAMERVALRETTEDLPYDPAWDADAFIADLEPGLGASWPVNAPHRVDNLGTFNLSLSIEYMTWEARLRHGTYYANGTLRRRFGMNPPPLNQSGSASRTGRWLLANGFKAIKINKAAQASFETEFDIAAGARG